MKSLVPVRLFKNDFFQEIQSAEARGATAEELKKILGKGKARLGMLEGQLDDGELEIGQVSGMITDIPSVSELFTRFKTEYLSAIRSIPKTI
jgi:enoyl-[acyl-carrier protein] reductase II